MVVSTHLKNINSWNWVISPGIRVENTKNIFETTKPGDELKLLNFLGQKKNGVWIPMLHRQLPQQSTLQYIPRCFASPKKNFFWNAFNVSYRASKKAPNACLRFLNCDCLICSVLTVNMSIDFSYIRVIHEWMDRHISFHQHSLERLGWLVYATHPAGKRNWPKVTTVDGSWFTPNDFIGICSRPPLRKQNDLVVFLSSQLRKNIVASSSP